MAITFLQQRKKQKYLLPILAVLILVTGIVLWGGLFTENGALLTPALPRRLIKEAEINFQVLENPVLEKLQPFEKIPPFLEEVGRGNPFLPF